MNQLKRLFAQIFLWLAIWCLLWLFSNTDYKFIVVNAPAYLMQILLLTLGIYVIIPKLLFLKKHRLFISISIIVILIGAFIAFKISPPPLHQLPLLPKANKPPQLASRFFINLLLMTVSYVLATLIETFVFAEKREKDSAFAKAELKDNELKFLKMQINPHFLFNALNNIYALSVTNSSKTQDSISTLSNMLRYVIYDCEQPKVSLRKELNYITAYINLFKLRSSKLFNITYKEQIDNATLKVAPMLFVPFIENAFKHSGVEKGSGNFINISLTQQKKTLVFKVTNSIPIGPIVTDKQGGIGLPNVKKRLELIYPNTHHLNIVSKEKFSVTLKIEL